MRQWGGVAHQGDSGLGVLTAGAQQRCAEPPVVASGARDVVSWDYRTYTYPTGFGDGGRAGDPHHRVL